MSLLSKIARLPRDVREALNVRLENGERSPEILPWLNALPEVKRVLAAHYKGVEVSDQNLSTWRETGYAEWLEKQQELAYIRASTEFAKSVMSESGLVLTEGAAAIAAGALQQRLEDLRRKQLAGEDVDDKLDAALERLTALRAGEISRVHAETDKDKQKLNREKHGVDKQKLALDREKFEQAQCQAVLKHAQSKEVQKIVAGPGTHSQKIAALRERMFPKRGAAQEAPRH